MARQQNVEHKRYRFSVPNADESVNQWIDAQGNLSHSLRELIKDYIRKYGITDATCMPVEQQARIGRPPKRLSQEETEQESIPEQGIEPESQQDTSVAPQEPQTAPKPAVPNRMSIPIVDGTEKGLQGVGNDNSGDTMMDMTAMMAGGGQ